MWRAADAACLLQAVLAARAVLKEFYNGHVRSEEASGAHSRDISLAAEHPFAGPCAPGTCPLDPSHMHAMEPVLPEAQAYLQLTHIARQLDMARMQAAVPSDVSSQQHFAKLQGLLSPAHAAVKRLAHTAAFHWVNLSSMFSTLEVS
jgi:hypothetical protein